MTTQRISIIDAIRGMAVLGILFANIQSWSGYKFVPFETIEGLSLSQYDHYFLEFHYWCVDGKFYAIFSMLFGAGFAIQYMKHRENQDPFLKVYRRRLGFLLMFGLLHMFIWSGDILTLYALMAFVLVAIRNLPYRSLLPVSLGLLGCFALLHLALLASGWTEPHLESTAHKTYADIDSVSYVKIFTDGSVADVFVRNLSNIYWRWADMLPNGRISRILGFFMLGFYLMRSGFFTEKIYQWKFLLVSGVVGLGLTVYVYQAHTNMYHWGTSVEDVFNKVLMVVAQTSLALTYMCLLAQVYRHRIGEKILLPLTIIGRMAFTNYLSHTLIGILIFYGFAGGLYGTFSLTQLYVMALVIYTTQVLMSAAWARKHKQGPVEWLWKCLTSKKWSSNLK